jgi:hypothetical protein
MQSDSGIMVMIAEQLGPQLYAACSQNNISQVQMFTSSMNTEQWSAAVLATASAKATDVTAYCMDNVAKMGLTDTVLRPYVYEIAPLTYKRLNDDPMGTALHKAAEYRQVGVIDVLLAAGADVSLKDTMGRMARDIAEQNEMDVHILADSKCKSYYPVSNL